jgi:hypothetical protein
MFKRRKPMLKTLLALAALLPLSPAALAGQVSDDMTCSEAIAHYERYRQIDTIANGTVLPIDQGTPIRQAGMLNCDADQGSRFETMVKTRDDPQCVIAAYCE